MEGYNLLGIVYSSEKDYDNALEAFQHALKLDPNSARTHNNLGNLYVAQEKFDLAEKEFGEVLRFDPTNREANYNLGLVLMARRSPAEAILHFQRVRPADIATRFNLVRAYLQAGRTAEGLKLARELSAQNKDDVQLHFTLGVLLAAEKAVPGRRNSNSKKPTRCSLKLSRFSSTWDRLIFAAATMQKPKLVLNRALKLKPDSAETLCLLAQVYSEQNQVR